MLRRHRWPAVMLAAVCLLAVVADAQDKSIVRVEPGRLMALVIGNEEYAKAPLRNPVNDARAVAGVLRNKLGFADENVELLENVASHAELKLAVKDFGARLRPTDLAFFYYSGHGKAVNRQNYLLPTEFGTDGPVEDKYVEYEALGEDLVRVALNTAQLRLIVLDACRNNPYGTDKSPTQGLVPAGSAAEGELLAYATGEGQTATDMGQGTGVYARHLVAALQEPGVEITQVFRTVRNKVYAETGKKQRPQVVDELVGKEFYFLPPKGPVGSGTGSGTGGGGVVRPPPEVPGWKRDWQELKDIKDPALKGGVEKYIEKYKDEAEADVLVEMAKGLLAKLERQERSARLAGSSWQSPLGMEFVWVPAGRFVMGSPESEEGRYDDERQHEVRISRGYWMGRYEVTQGEWKAVMGESPSFFSECGARCPVDSVSWEDVQEFISKLNKKESGNRYKYRLPTEAEWEYGARAGTAGVRHGELGSIAWYDGNSGDRTHPVGQKRANAWGLHDTLGNVWEWTADWYGDYPSGLVTDPRGPLTGSDRVGRGGGWNSGARDVRTAHRSATHSPGDSCNNDGFRLVRIE